MPESKKKEKKPKRMSSSRNSKEHLSFYKWIKDYGAILRNFRDVINEVITRIEAIEKKLGMNEKGE